MTTNIPKGAGRAAHNAKVKKHAQRTPLPPKGATSGVTKKVTADKIAEAVAEKPGPSARKRAGTAALSTSPDAAHDALREAPGGGSKLVGAKSRGRKATVRTRSDAELAEIHTLHQPVGAVYKKARKAAPVASKPTKAAPAPRTPRVAKAAATAKGGHEKAAPEANGSKAAALVQFALGVGWKSILEDGPMGGERVICEREPERVIVSFVDNKLDLAEMPVHEYGPRAVKLRNVSAAKKVMELPPEVAAKSQPSTTRRERKERERHDDDRGAVVVTRRLPWEADEEPTNAELLAYVVGRKLVWHNKVAGSYDEAHVLPIPAEQQRQLRVDVAPNGKRVLNWCSVEGAYRSVYIENLVQIR